MIELIDQTGRKVSLANHPQKIISIVPSQTELLFHLGLGKKLVGRTRFCIHPKDSVKKVKRIGGTKTLNIQEIEVLEPDLIIGNKEENDKEQIEYLANKFPVYLSDIISFESSLKMISDVSFLTNSAKEGAAIKTDILEAFSAFPKFSGTVAYLIWYNPVMVAANSTFINELLEKLGFTNAFANKDRYPVTSLEDLVELNPSYIFLSSEPFPFKEEHIQEISKFCPKSKIMLVDGEMFSWYGSRMLLAANYFKGLSAQIS